MLISLEFDSSLMANNPMLLLQILAYNVECIVKAFSEGMIEIAQNIQENEKISAERMLTCKSNMGKIKKYILSSDDRFKIKLIMGYKIVLTYLFNESVFHLISFRHS